LLAQNSTFIVVVGKFGSAGFFLPKSLFFQPFQPQNTFITPKNQSINLINQKKKVQTTKTNWKKYCILDLDLVF